MEISANERWWSYLARIRDYLYCIFMFFMPFTQVLTFNVGFPLKFSELALFLLGFLYLTTKRRIRIPLPVIVILSLLFLVVTVSVIVNLFTEYPYILRSYETRFGYTGDSIARYVYFMLALLSFFVSVDIFTENPQRYIRFWIYGALAAAAYSWYLAVFSFLGLPVHLLPGHPPVGPQVIGVFHRVVIRCGTFLEGNMMGLYLILSASLAFYIRKFKTGLFLLASVITTFSTLAFVCIFIFLLLYFQRVILQRKNLRYLFPAIVASGLIIYFFTWTDIYRKYVYEKLVARTDKIDNISEYSKADRLFSIKDAYGMGLGNPVFGVGLSNYARHYEHYMDKSNIDPLFIKNLLYRPNIRVIANNIYLEIWAESGGFALFLFLLLLGMLWHYSRWDTTKAVLPGFVCMLVCFIAYPSFIMIYLWCFMALPVAEYSRKKNLLI